jgi:hypothetical protein
MELWSDDISCRRRDKIRGGSAHLDDGLVLIAELLHVREVIVRGHVVHPAPGFALLSA